MGSRGMNDATKIEFNFEAEMNKYMKIYYDYCGYKYDFRGDRKKDIKLFYKNVAISVEHKYRKVEYNDILVEILQDMVSFYTSPEKAKGWLYECEADSLFYIICKEVEDIIRPVYFYDIQFKLFRNWLFNWLKINKGIYRTSVGGWGVTLNVAIPINVIPSDLLKKYEIPN
tara:strand:+ start:25 stop:537 length:513 start_codon:yes stop_codon:yes gene_type:complete